MKYLRKGLEAPTTILLFIAGVATVLMMLHIVADVAGKYLLNAPLPGTIETVSFYYMVVGVFFPLAYISRTRAHIVVELFTRKLSKRRLGALNVVVGLLTTAFMAVLGWKAVEEAVRRTAEGEVWETGYESMLIWPSRWILAVGCIAMALYVVVGIAEDLRNAARSGDS
jgi:TRAP-type C4-dicarboxylate transport system permease small subunit